MTNKFISKSNNAFTLVEVITSLAIVGVITAVVIFNYTKFNDNISLSSAGQEIAVAIREAQIYGLSVKETSVGSGQFTSAYGIHFSVNDPTNYVVFADTDASYTYDVGSGACGSSTTECIEKFSLKNNISIANVCDELACPPESSVRKLNIVFLRPSPDARIYFTNNGGAIKTGPSIRARIILTSTKGLTATTTVEVTGHILTK